MKNVRGGAATPRPGRVLYMYDAEALPDGILGGRSAPDNFRDHDPVPIYHGIRQVKDELDKLASGRATYTRALIRTHGDGGRIAFNGEDLYSWDWAGKFAGRNYEQIFPSDSRIGFDGCNVAEGPSGWTFLEEAGKVFLPISGGVVFGYTSEGFSFLNTAPFVGGKTLHFPGDQRLVTFGPRAPVIKKQDMSGDDSGYLLEGIKPLPRATLHESFTLPSFEGILLPTIARRIQPANVLGLAARVKALEEFFRKFDPEGARTLLARLERPLHGDKLAQAFHYYLSTATRIGLLQILKERAAGL